VTRTLLPLAISLCAILLSALTIYLTLHLRRHLAARRLTTRMRAAARAELLAEHWLTARGHQILSRQLTHRSTIWINDTPSDFDTRADLLVQMGQDRVLVEVKTGEAADPRSPATRRQLREYAAVYGVSVLYLFDADRQQLHRIDFGEPLLAADP
jgi:Holliday junction resolvase-like predicted endonuclease